MMDSIIDFIMMATVFVLTALVLVLAIQTTELQGRKWLIAGAALTVISETGYRLLTFLFVFLDQDSMNDGWFDLMGMVFPFAAACFAMFLFANWCTSRMDLDMRQFLFSFSGRIPRSAYWVALCMLFPLTIVTAISTFKSSGEGLPMVLNWTVLIVWIVAGNWIALAVYAKRWHDCSKSGWMSLVMAIPIIGPLWALGYQGFVRGTDGPNQYGDNPLRTR